MLRAEERGLFVTRLGPDGWFEIHSLVRNALLSELARTEPARIAELHARAAQWFESINEVALALDHWLLAEDPRSAMRLLSTKHDELHSAGMDATIRRTVAAIPADVAWETSRPRSSSPGATGWSMGGASSNWSTMPAG